MIKYKYEKGKTIVRALGCLHFAYYKIKDFEIVQKF